MSLKALVFDAYGTLFDVHSIAAHCATLWRADGMAISQLWRRKQLEYTWLLSLMGRYEDFWDVTKRALLYTCDSERLDATSIQVDSAMDAYTRLRPYADVRDSLDALRRFPLAILSNGCPRMLDPMIRGSELADDFDEVLSVDSVRVFKPSPKTYALALDKFGCDRSQIGFVSSNYWDVSGAASFGFTTFWLNRASAVPDRLVSAPHVTIATLSDLPRVAK